MDLESSSSCISCPSNNFHVHPLLDMNKHINRWSIIYIGLYGYKFSEAGNKACQLFEVRDWTGVVSDNLVHHVLMMASIVVACSAGTFGVLIEVMDGFFSLPYTDVSPSLVVFVIGSLLGYILSTMLMSVISSAYDTVLVCFASGSYELHKNHKYLSEEMMDAWDRYML